MNETMTSLGARRLRKALRPRIKASELAEKLGVSQQAINAWLAGTARPTLEHMARIEEIVGIPIRSWMNDVEDEDEDQTPTGTA